MNNTRYFQCYFDSAIPGGANIKMLPEDWENPYDTEDAAGRERDFYVGVEPLPFDYAPGPVTRYHIFDMTADAKLRRGGFHLVIEKRAYMTSQTNGIIRIDNPYGLQFRRNPESIATALSLIETTHEGPEEIIFSKPKPDWQINYYGLIRLLIDKSITAP